MTPCVPTTPQDMRGQRGRVLWIGRLSPEKRPEWLLKLAVDLPECRFDVIGQCNTGTPYGRRLVEQLTSLPNMTWHGYVPHGQMLSFYTRARVLLCTSESEGFPNVFLEAWACGTPVVSTVDPDDVIERHRLGWVASDFATLRGLIAMLEKQSTLCEERGQIARQYVLDNHSIAATLDAFEGVLRSAVTGS